MNGIDVSSNNHNGTTFDWVAVKKSGYDFVYVKTTEGTGYYNPFATGDIRDARAAGLLVGVYHYYRPLVDAKAQAEWFKSHGIDYDLMPVVDIEDNPTTASERDVFISNIGKCAQYMNRDFYGRLGVGNTAWTWLAWPDYSGQPLVGDIRIIQNGVGPVPGMPTPTDLNHTVGNNSILSNPFLPPETEDMDDLTFLTWLYRFTLFRAPDKDGFALWADQLAKGAQRAEVMALFQNGPEGVACLNAQRKSMGLSEVTAP